MVSSTSVTQFGCSHNRDAGVEVARAIGIDNIRAKCPHFNAWLEKLEALAQ